MFPSITLASCINNTFQIYLVCDNLDSWQLTQQKDTITESRIEKGNCLISKAFKYLVALSHFLESDGSQLLPRAVAEYMLNRLWFQLNYYF